MPSIDRRELLAGVVGSVSLAGCLGGDDSTDTDSPQSTASETASPTGSARPTGQFSLTPIDPSAVDGELTVLTEGLREWLRTAATTDESVRAHAGTYSYNPDPPLRTFERVQLRDNDGEVEGVYDLSVGGGTRYRLHVGAESIDPPGDADVTPVSSLSENRRQLALAAIGGAAGDDARVYPETELGSWVRHEFFGGYVSHDGGEYRGYERQQTDAEFFATNVWYVISASSVDAQSASITLRLAEVDPEVRSLIDSLREDTGYPQSVETSVEGETATAAQAMAEEHSLFLTHDAILRAEFEG